jgi:hypothetical protein
VKYLVTEALIKAPKQSTASLCDLNAWMGGPDHPYTAKHLHAVLGLAPTWNFTSTTTAQMPFLSFPSSIGRTRASAHHRHHLVLVLFINIFLF